MRNPAKLIMSASAVATLLGTLALTPQLVTAAETSVIEQGKALAFDRKKGNCLGCHMVDDGQLPGNVGPPLSSMKARFPDKAKLRAQIWDATKNNPNTMMPPFGRHEIMSDAEIDMVVEYILTL